MSTRKYELPQTGRCFLKNYTLEIFWEFMEMFFGECIFSKGKDLVKNRILCEVVAVTFLKILTTVPFFSPKLAYNLVSFFVLF